MSLSVFLGRELVSALGALDASRVLGPWRGCRPAEQRPRIRFAPAAYGEDDAHPHAELCLLLEGRCGFSFDHAGCRLAEGDLVILPGGMRHAESHYRPAESYRLAWWVLQEDEPGIHVTRYSQRGGFVMEHLMHLATLPPDARARVNVLRETAQAGSPPDIEVLREAMLTVTLALYRRILDGREGQIDARAQLVRRAMDFVRAHGDGPLALADVARVVHISPNYLTALFRAETGMSLGRFVLAERITLAQKRLRQPGASVKSVGLDLGFADPFTFSRAFKRVTGTAPRTWMENLP